MKQDVLNKLIETYVFSNNFTKKIDGDEAENLTVQ